MFHKFDNYGWHDGISEIEVERSTEIAPEMPIPKEKIDGQEYPNFTGYIWINMVYPGTTREVE